LEGEHRGELAFYGQGAGAYPTASAMFDDLVNIFSGEQVPEGYQYHEIDINNISNVPTSYYWRFIVSNEPGRLASISTYLASNHINIERLIQKNDVEGGIELVFLTSNVQSKEEVVESLSTLGIHCLAAIPYL
jgi:homoserine dehydrogenase